MQGYPHARAGGTPVSERSRAGFSMIELLIVASALLMALLFFSQSMGSTVALSGVNRETGLATEAAREVMERMQGSADFALVFRLYNDFPDDDPEGPGSAPGARFAVAGLDAPADDADGMVGEIRFPTVPAAGGPALREDIFDEALGMPHDLDGDGLVDGADKKGTYRLLPVELTLRWQGRTGVRSLQLQTLLANR